MEFREEHIEREDLEAKKNLFNANHHERRHDDDRILKLEALANEQRTIWYGSGSDPGVKDMIRDIHRTLHGAPDQPGLVARVSTLESKDAVRNRNMGIIGGVGMLIGGFFSMLFKKLFGVDL